jgi:hypothetical protein
LYKFIIDMIHSLMLYETPQFAITTLASLDGKCPPIGPAHDHCVHSHSSSSSTTSSSTSADTTTYASQESVSQKDPTGSSLMDPSHTSFWWLILAAVAAMFAIGAVVMGQRQQRANDHILTGSVARRMGLFSTFADSALCARTEPRTVEMTTTTNADDYQMAHV